MSPEDIWQIVYDRFDPERAADDPALRVDRPTSPATDIIKTLDRPRRTPRVLVTGTVGTGKTTELLRVAEARKGKEIVVFLDLERHFSEVIRDAAALQRITPWEVCFLAGLGLIAAYREQCALSFPDAHLSNFAGAWADAAKRSDTPRAADVDVGTLTKSLIQLAAGGAALAAGPGAAVAVSSVGGLLANVFGALKLNVPVGRSKHDLSDQEREAQTMRDCVNVLVGIAQSQARRVLFVIDGLDRVRDIDRAKALFVDSQMIAELACPVVVCGPFALRHHPATAAVRGFSDVLVLVNEPVLLQTDPTKYGNGVLFFCQLFQRRIADLGPSELIPKPLLEELAYRSGGRARDFVRLIRVVADEVLGSNATVATSDIVAKALDKVRRQRETGLHKGHLRLLEEVAADPEHRLPEGALAQELLSYGTLLPYPNESEWYYPHPLLTMHLVKVPSSTRSEGN